MAETPIAAPPPAQYVNLMQVASTEREFFFDFAQASNNPPGSAALIARIVTSPAHARAMFDALAEQIRKHEERFGEIPVSNESITGNPVIQ